MSSGTGDKIKGRVKETAGALFGERKLKREGQADQLAGKVAWACGLRRRVPLPRWQLYQGLRAVCHLRSAIVLTCNRACAPGFWVAL